MKYYKSKDIFNLLIENNFKKISLSNIKSDLCNIIPIDINNGSQVYSYESILPIVKNKYFYIYDIFVEYNKSFDRKINFFKFKEPELSLYTVYEDGVITDYTGLSIGNNIGKHGYFEFGSNTRFSKVLGIRLKHRIIAHCVFDIQLNKDIIIDHIDRNKTNNQISNLRITDRSGNTLNSIKYRDGILYINKENGKKYITDNPRKLEREYPEVKISSTHVYRILNGEFDGDTKYVKIQYPHLEENNVSKDMFNYIIEI